MSPDESGIRAKADLDLVRDFRSGSVESFNEIVRRYREKVYWIARRVVGTHDDADDVVQEVFVRVYDSLKRFRGDSNFYTWLYRISVNVSLSAIRAKRIKNFVRSEEVVEHLVSDEELADDKILRDEYEKVLKQAIDRLPPKQKTTFVMRYYEEMEFEEMSKVLNKSVGGLKANYFHAVRKIRDYVKKETGG